MAITSGVERLATPRPGDRISVDELARRKGVRPVISVEDMAQDGVFESDEEVDAFIEYVHASRHADLGWLVAYVVLDSDVSSHRIQRQFAGPLAAQRGRASADRAEHPRQAGPDGSSDVSVELRYLVVIEHTGGTGFSAWAPDLPGCIAAAGTREECEQLMREAIALHLAGTREDGHPIPAPSAVDAVMVSVPVA